MSNITATVPDVSQMGGYQWYGYGAYYNWYSAMAENGTYNMASGVSTNGDIYPAGWRLPKIKWNSGYNSDYAGYFSVQNIKIGKWDKKAPTIQVGV